MSSCQDRWFEVWFDQGEDLVPTYLLIVVPDNAHPGLVLVCDPLENNRVVHEGHNYEETCFWLGEDEYSLVTGRVFIADPFPLATIEPEDPWRNSVRMNERMRSSLGQTDPAEFAKSERLSEDLSHLLAQGFTNLDGAIIFTAMRNIAKKVGSENFSDKTAFECFVNHIHVEDQLHELVLDHVGLLKQSITFALTTERQLRSRFPAKPFKVIVAASAGGCGVRFHVARPGEEWLASDLDGYGEEAVLVVET